MIDGSVHEQEFVRSFISNQKRDRVLMFLSNPKRRLEFTQKLAHFDGFEPRYVSRITASVAHTAEELAAVLRSKGSTEMIWAISGNKELDGRAWLLDEALKTVWGSSYGTILSCIPGKLAFFRGEEMKSETLLQRA